MALRQNPSYNALCMSDLEIPELIDALMTTRSMRRLHDTPVDDSIIESVLTAAVQAPSGGNIQPYQFLVVTDPELKASVGEWYLKSWERYEPAVAKVTPAPPTPEAEASYRRNKQVSDELAHNFGNVPVQVFVLTPQISMAVSDDEGEMDVGPVWASVYPAVQNLMLAARAYGLGTTLTTVIRVYEDEVRELLGVPDRYAIAAVVPIGYPKGKWGVARRRPASSITNWNQFGNRRR